MRFNLLAVHTQNVIYGHLNYQVLCDHLLDMASMNRASCSEMLSNVN